LGNNKKIPKCAATTEYWFGQAKFADGGSILLSS